MDEEKSKHVILTNTSSKVFCTSHFTAAGGDAISYDNFVCWLYHPGKGRDLVYMSDLVWNFGLNWEPICGWWLKSYSILSSCFSYQIPFLYFKYLTMYKFHHPGDFVRTHHKRSEPIHYCVLWLILLFQQTQRKKGIPSVHANNLDIIRSSSVSSPLYPLLYQLIPVDNHSCSSLCCAVQRECGFGATFFRCSLFCC
jgi:hypothetical protein